MKTLFEEYTEEKDWLLKDVGWKKDLQPIRESQFTLGNGYLGIRGIFEELPLEASPGTYIAGIFDEISSQVSELVNLPNPVDFRFTVEGHKLDPVAMDFQEHHRVLNLKQAVLVRQSHYRDRLKRNYDYQSLRLVSMDRKNIGLMRVSLTALDQDCVVDITSSIDFSADNGGILSEGRKRLYRIREVGQREGFDYLIVQTLEKKHTIVYWSGLVLETEGKRKVVPEHVLRLRFKKNTPMEFTRIFCLKHCPATEDLRQCRDEAYAVFRQAFDAGAEETLDSHVRTWQGLWKRADVRIRNAGDDVQTNLRFNIYHMLISGNCDNGFSSVGARTLSGEGYRGHVFWDAEIFILPFFLFNFPEIARSMLLYRWNRLDKARELAKATGYRGARFAWESADTGSEETPEWARDVDGTITRIHTHQMEYHIVADVAYALMQYYAMTGDEDFMRQYGYEMLFETARFWASLIRFDKDGQKCGIEHVIGPDEFHVDVNNNAFTNLMARWNLRAAEKMYYRLRGEGTLFEPLAKKISLRQEEPETWRKMAEGIKFNLGRNRMIEQFDGFFKLKEIIPEKTNQNGLPLIPEGLSARDLEKTQLVKQADVLMLLFLLQAEFPEDVKAANYIYYIDRTVHKSSLSPSIHAIMAAAVHDLRRAYDFFNISLHADIANLYRNTSEGIHAASLGGTWQAVIFGFAGIKIESETVIIDPRLPADWDRVSFSIRLKNTRLNLKVGNEEVKVRMLPAKKIKTTVKVRVYENTEEIRSEKTYTFRRKPEVSREYYY